MTTIDDLIYSPIITEDLEASAEEAKTFKELCLEASLRKKKIEDEFKHLRGKLIVRENADGSADVVHKELASQIHL